MSQPVAGQRFEPFSASVEHPALYMGFLPLGTDPAKGRVAFPANTSIELLLWHRRASTRKRISRWHGSIGTDKNGRRWASSTRRGLHWSGIVGFFGPPDHKHRTEFGRDAYWLTFTARTSSRRTVAVEAERRTNLFPARPGIAAMPRIVAIRLNVVPANNGESLTDEILAPATAKKPGPPPASGVRLADIRIEIREQDEHTEAADQTWIAWQRVPNLLSCDPTDRCYTLDPTSAPSPLATANMG